MKNLALILFMVLITHISFEQKTSKNLESKKGESTPASLAAELSGINKKLIIDKNSGGINIGEIVKWEIRYIAGSQVDGPSYKDTIGIIGTLGAIYVNEKDRVAHIIYGAIFKKWTEVGARQFVGIPVNDEAGCTDGIGRFNDFVNEKGKISSIYYKKGVGAHLIYGEILAKWKKEGDVKSKLGYPKSEEEKLNSWDGWQTQQFFENGKILWKTTGAEVVLSKAID